MYAKTRRRKYAVTTDYGLFHRHCLSYVANIPTRSAQNDNYSLDCYFRDINTLNGTNELRW